MKPTNSKGKSPWKVKKVAGSRGYESITMPKGAVLVNQGLRKIKIEEEDGNGAHGSQRTIFPTSVEPELPVNSMATSTNGDAGGEDGFTEEFTVTVTKEEPDNLMLTSEAPPSHDDANCSSSPCQGEIESLKCTVKQLSLQVQKQNEVIREIKSGLRNAVMSLMACCKDEEENESHNYESSGPHEPPEMHASGSLAEESILFESPSVTRGGVQHGGTPDTLEDESCLSSSIAIAEYSGDDGSQILDESSNQSFISMETSSNFGYSQWQSTEHDSEEEDEERDHDDNEDNSYMPGNDNDDEGESEVEHNQGHATEDNQEDDHNDYVNEEEQEDVNDTEDSCHVLSQGGGKIETDRNGNKRKPGRPRRLSRKTDQGRTTTSSKPRAKGTFGCPKCRRSFQLETVLRHHLRHVHSNSKIKVSQNSRECHLCGKVYGDYRPLRRHILSVHEGARFKCAHCPREFTELKGVRYHEDTVHNGTAQREECQVCGQTYADRRGLQIHMKRVHNKSEGSRSSTLQKKKRVQRLRKKK